MKYLFILGRNPLLSEAEILSVFERDGIMVKASKLKMNAILVETDNPLDLKRLIGELGGTIAIGKVLISGKGETALGEIREKPIYRGRENKVIYSVLNYAGGEDEFQEVLDAIKENFSNERLKARYKGVSGTIKLQDGKVVHGSPEKILLRDMNYFVFDNAGEINFGLLEESYDSSEIENRDMKKPYRRESLAISPRLARILINLSQVKENEKLLDPFCGIGVILGEGLIRNMDVMGVDIDDEAASNARNNIEWLRKNYKISKSSNVLNYDSKKVKLKDIFNGVATEPSLGELMTKMPNRDRAREIIFNFENLIIGVLNNAMLALKLGSKIAFTSPLIKTQGGRISCNFGRICGETGLRIQVIKGSGITFPIKEYREDQIVGREICVLVK